jgi:hypothetical protein
MRNVFSKMAAIAFAALAFGQPVVTQAQPSSHSITSNEGKEMNRPPEKINTRRKFSLPDFIGSVPIIHVGGGGTPPHIYGMYHAKRGAHKRLNRK